MEWKVATPAGTAESVHLERNMWSSTYFRKEPEFVAYLNLCPVIGNLSDKAAMIISFALFGFANLSSMSILIGGLGGIALDKRSTIAGRFF